MDNNLVDKVPADVFDRIVACDPRYKHHLPDGRFVIEVDLDLASINRTYTLSEYLEEHEIGLDEIIYTSIDHMRDTLNAGATTRAQASVGLDQLRWLFELYVTEQREVRRVLYEFGMAALDDGTLGDDE